MHTSGTNAFASATDVHTGVASVSLVLQLMAWRPAVSKTPYFFPASTTLKDKESYEYIVVGAGAAGCAVAAGLAVAGKRVILLEAGGDPDLLSRFPAAAMGLLGSPLDWAYDTQPNNVSCLSSLGRQCRFSRGKCLGGSTSINYMLYTRGNRRDYDDYRVPGWSWEDLKPYFLRYEGLQVLNQLPASSKPYHNTCGIMELEFFADPKNPWKDRLIEGFKSIGFGYNADVNGVSQVGVSQIVGYVYEDERMSAARAYLTKDSIKQKLTVAKNTYCTRINFNDQKVAKGVTVVQDNTNKTLYATKEVIVSAGAIESPKLLMSSGIGPADHLKQMGIPVLADLPVGDNMSDHVLALMFIEVDGGDEADVVKDTIHGLFGNGTEATASHGSLLGSNNLVDINLFANTSCYSRERQQLGTGAGCDLPSAQLIHAYIPKGALPLAKPIFQNIVHLDNNVIDQIAARNFLYPLIVVSPINLTPASRGYVKLATSDPLDKPKIFPNYLGDERDVEELCRSIGIIETLVASPTFKKHNAKLLHLKLPDCPSYEEGRENYWRCYAKHVTFSVFHSAGTCSLMSCVDTKLRVKGVQSVRVADLSIYPTVMRGNTAAPAIAAGERLIDFMLGKNHKKYKSKCKTPVTTDIRLKQL